MIDQTSVNLLDLIPTDLKKVASTNGGEYAGACPMCGGKDRFRVQPNAQPNPRWFCRKCSERGGDAIAFLMSYANIDFTQACNELNLQLQDRPQQRRNNRPTPPTPIPYAREKETESDGKTWQQRAKAFIQYTDKQMWGDDATALGYLAERGFYKRTIENAGLGYCPKDMWDDWGLEKKVWLPRGIVIPYSFGDFATIEKIRTRRLDWTPDDQYGKYIPPRGVKNVAYLNRRLLVGDYVVIVEGELDAIMLKQEVESPRVVGFATSGTHGAKLLKYLALLALARKVIVAFDNDDAGNKASEYWLDALPNAVRHAPTAHDINDMVLHSQDLNEWLGKAVR